MKAGDRLMLASGNWAYRYAVQSDGAVGIRLHFQNFDVHEGEVWVYDIGRRASFGPYSGSGPNSNGDFWTPTLPSDTVVVEYDSSQAAVGAPPFVISDIGHIAAKGDVDSLFASSDDPGGRVTSNLCAEIDVSCYADWADKSSGVTLFAVVSGDVLYACNGTLLNSARNDFTPYFLTSARCVSDQAAAQSMEFVWDYQSSDCGGWFPADVDQTRLSLLSPSGPVPTTVGAQLLVSGAVTNGDYTLVKVNSLPNMGLEFYGWDTADDIPVGGSVAAIHHPGADATRIAFGVRDPDSNALYQNGLPVSTPLDSGSYYQVRVIDGHLESGSSGSPLFSQDGRLLGTLTSLIPWGACLDNPFVIQYFRFAKAYPQLARYLGSSNPGTAISVATPIALSAAGTISLSKSSTSWNWSETWPAQSYPEYVSVATTAAGPQSVAITIDQPWINVSDTRLTISQAEPGIVRVWIEPSAIVSKGPDTGTVTFTAASGNQQTFKITLQALATAFEPTGLSPKITVFPLVVQGPGHATTFQVSNPYATPSNSMVQMQEFNGNPLIIEPAQDYYGNLDSGVVATHGIATPAGYPVSRFNNLLQPNEVRTYSTTMAPPSRQGMAVSFCLGEQDSKSLPITEKIGEDMVNPAIQVSVPFGIPFDATQPGTTNLFIYNTDLLPNTYTVAGYDTSGTFLGTLTINVKALAGGMVSVSATDQTFGGRKGLLVVTGKYQYNHQLAAGLRMDANGHIANIPPAQLSNN